MRRLRNLGFTGVLVALGTLLLVGTSDLAGGARHGQGHRPDPPLGGAGRAAGKHKSSRARSVSSQVTVQNGSAHYLRAHAPGEKLTLNFSFPLRNGRRSTG